MIGVAQLRHSSVQSLRVLLHGLCRFYCVALTDQLLHSRIALEQYQKHSMHLETLVRCNRIDLSPWACLRTYLLDPRPRVQFPDTRCNGV